jgi:hypothetical protein
MKKLQKTENRKSERQKYKERQKGKKTDRQVDAQRQKPKRQKVTKKNQI